MPRASIIEQKGRVIRIEGDDYEFRAEDVEWATMHRAALKRTARGVRLTFMTVEAAQAALEEIIELGAANAEALGDVTPTSDVLTALVKRLLGE